MRTSRIQFNFLKLLVAPLFSCSVFALDGNIIRDIQHIEVTSEISLAGTHLCQDGQKIYFKSEEKCELANREAARFELPQFHCQSNLEIAPISELELIYTQSDLEMQRFFRIPTSFRVVEKVLHSEVNPEDAAIISDKVETISYCEFTPKLPFLNFIQKRQTDSKAEEILITDLLENDIFAINKAKGQVNSVKNLIAATPDLAELMSNFHMPQLDIVTPLSSQIPARNDWLKDFKIQTPICNQDLSEDHILQLLGGWTGGNNGSVQKNYEKSLSILQDHSKSLKIQRNLSDENWRKIVRGELKRDRLIFDMKCL